MHPVLILNFRKKEPNPNKLHGLTLTCGLQYFFEAQLEILGKGRYKLQKKKKNKYEKKKTGSWKKNIQTLCNGHGVLECAFIKAGSKKYKKDKIKRRVLGSIPPRSFITHNIYSKGGFICFTKIHFFLQGGGGGES